MKTLKLLFASVLVLFVFSIPAVAVTVTGTGDPSIDVPALQAAVDAGGLVQLQNGPGDKAIHLGNDTLPYMADDPATPYTDERYGSVSITNDVIIDGVGTAVIIGGENSISCDGNFELAVMDTTIKEGKRAAIYVTKAIRVEITGCTIKNIKKATSYPPADPYTRSAGIYVTTGFNPPDVAGNVTISDNNINLNEDLKEDYKASFQIGILLSFTASNAQITGNSIYNCNYAGIMIISNPGDVTIADDNVIETGPPMPDDDDPTYYAGYSVGNGIDVYSAWIPFLPSGSVSVIGNEVVCVNPNADGIIFSGEPFLPGATNVISGNTVTMGTPEEYSECGALACLVDNSVWENNTVNGYGKYGIRLEDASSFNSFNVYQGQIENFDAVEAHVFCGRDTHDNKFKFFDVKRGDVKITDKGKDNENEFEWLTK